MDRSDEMLVAQLKESLAAGTRKTAFAEDAAKETQDDAPHANLEPDENPLETDFFKAMNAFRAARTSGDPEAMARAEEHLRNVVRGELTGEDCAH